MMRRAVGILVLACAAGIPAGPARAEGGVPDARAAKGRRVGTERPKPAAGGEAPRRSVEELLVSSRDPFVRESCAQVLGQIGNPESVALLTARMDKDEDKWVRARAAEALGLIGSPAGLRVLRSFLAKETDQQVRRMAAQALARLGQRAGIEELLWQLKAGNHHAQAEVMQFLVELTGQPLGQDVEAWYTYFSGGGYALLALRSGGSPALHELRGLEDKARGSRRLGPFLETALAQPYQRVPAVVLVVEPRCEALTRERLERIEEPLGRLPDGALLLLHFPRPATAAAPGPAPCRGPKDAGRCALPSAALGAPPPGPGLTPEAALHLLARFPKLLGVGIDAVSLDPPPTRLPGARGSARSLLLAAGRMVLEGLDDLELVPRRGGRLLLVPASVASGRILVRAFLLQR
jgi:hypothetical protein